MTTIIGVFLTELPNRGTLVAYCLHFSLSPFMEVPPVKVVPRAVQPPMLSDTDTTVTL